MAPQEGAGHYELYPQPVKGLLGYQPPGHDLKNLSYWQQTVGKVMAKDHRSVGCCKRWEELVQLGVLRLVLVVLSWVIADEGRSQRE